MKGELGTERICGHISFYTCMKLKELPKRENLIVSSSDFMFSLTLSEVIYLGDSMGNAADMSAMHLQRESVVMKGGKNMSMDFPKGRGRGQRSLNEHRRGIW